MQINEDIVPSTIESAVKEVISALDAEDRAAILQDSLYDQAHSGNMSVDAQVHHTVGRHLRNQWSLWNSDSPLKRDAVTKYGIAHADDISSLIIRWVVAIIKGETFDPVAACDVYKNHWAKMGIDALTAGGWSKNEQTDEAAADSG